MPAGLLDVKGVGVKIATDIAEGFNQGAGTQGAAMFVEPWPALWLKS
jgi:hypothetical protein